MMKKKLLWFTLGFTSAVAAAMTVFICKDLCSQVKVDTLDIKISNLEPALNGLRPNSSSNLLSLNVSVNGINHTIS